jgi:hypothetical protein
MKVGRHRDLAFLFFATHSTTIKFEKRIHELKGLNYSYSYKKLKQLKLFGIYIVVGMEIELSRKKHISRQFPCHDSVT